ncbi:MAG: response regulator [Armatimonadota bacterium]|nr:response regulator [Armatimonadota bacterium]
MPENKILIADDEKGIRDLFVEALERHGFTVLAAKDGREAVDIIKKGGVSTAFLDIRMPGLNGIDALREILEISPDTQVVMITGHYEDSTVEEALRRGSFLCLMKPFKVRDVLALLDVLEAQAEFREAKRQEPDIAA